MRDPPAQLQKKSIQSSGWAEGADSNSSTRDSTNSAASNAAGGSTSDSGGRSHTFNLTLRRSQSGDSAVCKCMWAIQDSKPARVVVASATASVRKKALRVRQALCC